MRPHPQMCPLRKKEPLLENLDLNVLLHAHFLILYGSNDEKWNSSVKKKWGISLPRNEKGLLKVYNAGMVVFSNEGIQRAKKEWEPFQTYIDYIS